MYLFILQALKADFSTSLRPANDIRLMGMRQGGTVGSGGGLGSKTLCGAGEEPSCPPPPSLSAFKMLGAERPLRLWLPSHQSL